MKAWAVIFLPDAGQYKASSLVGLCQHKADGKFDVYKDRKDALREADGRNCSQDRVVPCTITYILP